MIVSGLLALAAAGTRARAVTHLPTSGMLAAGARPVTLVIGVVIIAAACLVLIGLLVLLARGRRRRAEDEWVPVNERPGTWWTRALAALIALALAALPVAALVVALRSRRSGQRTPPWGPVAPVVPHLPGARPAPGGAGVAALVIAVLAAGAAGVIAVWLRRRSRAVAPAPPAEGGPTPLAAAVAAGSSALGTGDTPREAIISCYAAMEGALATAGSPRRAADTPEELLSRAVAGGIIRTPAARRLTALFREARFSPHEIGESQRQAAQDSITEISRELGAAL